MVKRGKGDKLEARVGFVYPPRGFIFRNPEPADFSCIFLLRRVHASHPGAGAHAHSVGLDPGGILEGFLGVINHQVLGRSCTPSGRIAARLILLLPRPL